MIKKTSTDMPKVVRISYRDFVIEKWSSVLAHSSNRFGECDTLNGVIRVAEDLNNDKMANTLLHEILHACWSESGLEEREDEERVVICLANQLSQVWKNNPNLIKFLSENLK